MAIEEVETTLSARDGYPLSATIFKPRGDPSAIAIISAAMATPAKLYKLYARHLARKGRLAVIYDFRGVGGSGPDNLRGFQALMSDWAELDMAAVIDWAADLFPDLPIFLIGHSFGGQAAGLLDNAHKVAAMVTVSSQSGYWGLHPGTEKWRVLFYAYLGFPLLVRLFGYLPWSRFARGEDLPKDAALQWAGWSRSRDYLCGDRNLPSVSRFPGFKAPILAYSFEDDVWGSKPSVDDMMSRYSGAPVERRHVAPADIGVEKIGHLGFFLPVGRALWRQVDEWLEERS